MNNKDCVSTPTTKAAAHTGRNYLDIGYMPYHYGDNTETHLWNKEEEQGV